jgi:hypothetical protein
VTVEVSNNDVVCTAKRYPAGFVQLTSAWACAAYSTHVRPIAAPQNLHATIAATSQYNVALPIQRNSAPAVDLPWTTAFAAHAAHVDTVAHTRHFNTAVDNEMVLL